MQSNTYQWFVPSSSRHESKGMIRFSPSVLLNYNVIILMLGVDHPVKPPSLGLRPFDCDSAVLLDLPVWIWIDHWLLSFFVWTYLL